MLEFYFSLLYSVFLIIFKDLPDGKVLSEKGPMAMGYDSSFESCQDFYHNLFNIDSPYDHQKEVWKRLLEGNFPLLLRAPTGSGKTEAVLAPFLSQFLNNDFTIAPRLIYVLPMRVLANSIAERIQKYARNISPNISVKIHHGDIPSAPFFIDDIVVTTLDQFLYGFARVSKQVGHHIDMPAGSIVSSLVVFDEAHLYRDEFTFSIMRALLEILHVSRVPFVVMTATMPQSLERSLFERIKLPLNQKLTMPIPNTSQLSIKMNDLPLYQEGRVNIDEDLLGQISQKKTLIVANQVKRAKKVYEELQSRLSLSDEQIVLLHSRFKREDRDRHEKTAVSLIPHKEDSHIVVPDGAGIVVSTQVLEAGIDFSAELLLTELAPADSLIQRAGRCARYNGQKGEMIIFPLDKENRAYLPYDENNLQRTLQWLVNHPSFDIRDFQQTCLFVDETLDYRANDFEAADTLIDLYECVLYADSEPDNIQLRKSKPVTLIVADIQEGSEEKVRKEIEQQLTASPHILKDNAINIDINLAWGLFRDPNINIRWEIRWAYDEKEKKHKLVLIDLLKNREKKDTEDSRIGPFRTYILSSRNYEKNKGIEPDVTAII
ncbi:MAG TPA: CRISPR-associated helicase Cas3' [Candidatus Saccharicenans sp.]|nr:CRISPR-associated helicase Cas3' [Candidatus Saccharicenans sp.]HPU92645.1 CRISPR-associated helicase Cas3' [Candidatus Saccharicenans sp.]